MRGAARTDLPTAYTRVRPGVIADERGFVEIANVLVLFFASPVILPVEAFRGWRERRHNREMIRMLESPRAPHGGYRDNARFALGLVDGLRDAEELYAIDYAMWERGSLLFSGAAVGAVRGTDCSAPWFTVYRGAPPAGVIDAKTVVDALSDMRVTLARWEWERDDPYEVVERA
jgi:hypothetical protein